MHVRIAWEIYKNQQRAPAPVSAAGRPAEPPLLATGAPLRPSMMDMAATGPPHPLGTYRRRRAGRVSWGQHQVV